MAWFKDSLSRLIPQKCEKCGKATNSTLGVAYSDKTLTMCRPCAMEAMEEAAQALAEKQLGLVRPASAFVRIPAGEFLMGSPENDKDASSKERPQHRVVITRAYEFMTTPVTETQYDRVMGVGATKPFRPCPSNLTWYEAVEYCNAQSKARGLPEAYEFQGSNVNWRGLAHPGWRLPTEAEWEYACRAGTTASRYGELDEIAWWEGNSFGETHPVGQKKANAWGLHDMLGNVGEWVWDCDGDYAAEAVVDPIGPNEDSGGRVVRGGGMSSASCFVRSAFRSDFPPHHRMNVLGCRPARSVV